MSDTFGSVAKTPTTSRGAIPELAIANSLIATLGDYKTQTVSTICVFLVCASDSSNAYIFNTT